MKKLSLALSLVLAFSFCFVSCQKTDEVKSEQQMVDVFFDAKFPTDKKAGHITNEPIPTDCEAALVNVHTAYLEIRPEGAPNDGTGDLEFSSEVFVFNEDGVDIIRTTEAVQLPPGNHQLVSFYVTDNSGDPLVAIPTTNSEYATFVDNPLPHPCVVVEEVRKMYQELEILCIDFENEPNFGLKYFDLAVIRTMPFCMLVNICDEDGRHRTDPMPEFNLKIWRYTGDCKDPKGKMLLDIDNYSDKGVEDNNSDEESDPLLCTYLPDRTDEDDCFWMEVWVKDANSPWANNNVKPGYYLVECGYLCEDEIKEKWLDRTEYGVDNNFFHVQVSHSQYCSPGKKVLKNDCCEESFFYSNIDDPGQAGVNNFGVFKYLTDGSSVYYLGMIVDDSDLNDEYSAHIAYNDDDKVLYLVNNRDPNGSTSTLYSYNEATGVMLSAPFQFQDRVVPQAVYYGGYLFGADQNTGQVYRAAVDTYGMPILPADVIYSGPDYTSGGDMIMGQDSDGYFLYSVNSGSQSVIYRLSGLTGTVTKVYASYANGGGLPFTGMAVVNGAPLVSTKGPGGAVWEYLGVVADGPDNGDIVLGANNEFGDFEWGDMASCSTLNIAEGTIQGDGALLWEYDD